MTNMLVYILQLIAQTLAANIISSSTFTTCAINGTAQVSVDRFNFVFSKDTKHIIYAITGSSTAETFVNVQLLVTAYGMEAMSKTVDPCTEEYFVQELCPLAQGPFDAQGDVELPDRILNQIPEIAYKVPDLNGYVTMNLITEAGTTALCLQAPVGNGESFNSPTSQSVTNAVAAGTLMVCGASSLMASISAAGSASSVNGPTFSHSPNMGDIMLWFQTMALSGAFSVEYPTIVRSFSRNFAWSTGMVHWDSMQTRIDIFRRNTGGDLAASSVQSLQGQILVFGSHYANETQLSKRSLQPRQAGTTTSESEKMENKLVNGLTAFAEQVHIPSRNAFVTLLLFFLIMFACLIAASIIFRFVLEAGSKWKKCPRKLLALREHYWRTMIGLALRGLLVLYGIWCLFCFYEFKYGDSWAASVIAGITLGIMTGLILWFTYHVVKIAYSSRKQRGIRQLYENKQHLNKYGWLYDQFKAKFWWFFIPCTIYAIVKAFFLAIADGHGFVQVIGCMACEVGLLIFLFATRAYDDRKANIVNVMISVVRLISLAGTLIFVDVLNFKETTKTITGMVVIVLQSVLTVVLIVLVLINAIVPLIKKKSLDDEAKTAEELTPLGPEHEKLTGEQTKTSYELHRNSTSTLGRLQEGHASGYFNKGNAHSVTLIDLGPAEHARPTNVLIKPQRSSTMQNMEPGTHISEDSDYLYRANDRI